MVARVFISLILGVFVLSVAPVKISALEMSPDSQRSFYFGFDIGAGLDLDPDARRVSDITGEKQAAYTLTGFMFGVDGGFRFNEMIGIESGWHRTEHTADPDWGDSAGYNLGYISLRLAIPTLSRQTVVFKAGPTFGSFFYGNVLGIEDNKTVVFGGRGGLCLEHEFALGVVGVFEISYYPIFRYGMNGQLYLSEDSGDERGLVLKDTKDFTEGKMIHLLLLEVGVQFEWTLQ